MSLQMHKTWLQSNEKENREKGLTEVQKWEYINPEAWSAQPLLQYALLEEKKTQLMPKKTMLENTASQCGTVPYDLAGSVW